jgi:beta-aspartyl-peptidase (threonine type)
MDGRPRPYLGIRLGLILIGVLLLGSLAVYLRLRSQAGRPEATTIQQLLDAQVAAWNKGDLEGFMQVYWRSPELSFFSGKDKTHGWEATLKRYQKRYQAEGRQMGTLTLSEIQIEPLSTDSAFVRGRWQLVLPKENPGGLFTLVFKKQPEGWRIVHDHTSTEPAPAGNGQRPM